MHAVHGFRAALLLLVVLAACAGPGQSRSADSPGPTVSAPPGASTSGDSEPSATTGPGSAPSGGQAWPIEGVLPNGTLYELVADSLGSHPVEGVSAAVVIDLPDGSSPVIGVTSFGAGRMADATRFADGILRVSAGDWTVGFSIYDHVLEALGPDAGMILESAIVGRSVRDLPVLDLAPPFRFASDDEVPLQMQVMYDEFVVMRGCTEELGAVCSATRAVQALPLSAVVAPAPDVPLPAGLLVESPAPRPVSDRFYLDPGPLTPRGAHHVLWTGEEMIVWGGATGDGSGFLVDGAAFHAEGSSWRMLSPAPLDPQTTLATWTGEEMIVAGSLQAGAYDPDRDRWRAIDEPGFPIRSASAAAWTGREMLAWSGEDMAAYDPDEDRWVPLPTPPFGGSRRTLHVTEGEVLAVGFDDERCFPLRAARLSSEGWEALPEVDLGSGSYKGCVLPETTAIMGRRLVAWDSGGVETRTMALDLDTGRWSQIATIPLHGSESWPEPLVIGDRLVAFHYVAVAAIYDPVRNQWQRAKPPGGMGSGDAVWTGTEVLMWGATCCYGTGNAPFRIDAWRWTPPE